MWFGSSGGDECAGHVSGVLPRRRIREAQELVLRDVNVWISVCLLFAQGTQIPTGVRTHAHTHYHSYVRMGKLKLGLPRSDVRQQSQHHQSRTTTTQAKAEVSKSASNCCKRSPARTCNGQCAFSVTLEELHPVTRRNIVQMTRGTTTPTRTFQALSAL